MTPSAAPPSTSAAGERIADALRRFFAAAAPEVSTAYLFGSTARGTRRADSDVDVAVLLAEDPPRTLEGLRFDLAAELERYVHLPVQLVILNRAPADLVHRVLRDGVLLVDRDPSARIRYEVRKRNEYFDLLPMLRRYRRLDLDDGIPSIEDLRRELAQGSHQT